MKIAILGAGPAGLLSGLLLKRRFPDWRIEITEQNPPDATFGFGVVFSEGALAFLERDAPDFYRLLMARMETWPIQRIVHRNEPVDIDGNGFSAIARLHLNSFLQDLARDAGVIVRYGRGVTSLDEFSGADLLVAADGVNSFVRNALAAQFEPQTEWLTNRFAWYGTERLFDCLTLTFRESPDGVFVAHHYRYSRTMSTFIVECDERTWQQAGFERMDDAQSRAYCEKVFAPDLEGRSLVSNRSIWRRFPILSNRRWTAGNVVLLGDALRTMHFSIGSGTRAAFEDAIALDRAFAEAGADVPRALTAFERTRRPVVDKMHAAANQSSYWYERMAEKMQLAPLELAWDYMTRSGRMTEERLAALAPQFVARVRAGRGA